MLVFNQYIVRVDTKIYKFNEMEHVYYVGDF